MVKAVDDSITEDGFRRPIVEEETKKKPYVIVKVLVQRPLNNWPCLFETHGKA